MPWVQFDANNNICGVCANKQSGVYTEQMLSDDDPTVVAFLNPLPDPRVAALKADTNRTALLTKLKTATPAQIRAYINGLGIADPVVAQAIANILIVIALDARQ